ncbi:endonuclease/exonuclease/phosphatase family protein [Mycoplasma sp. Mirounga ES2805-ORL]|uniref:endonuclease/exonuclease/phosphatase family protein n=1 Tax=Mycoplasma sp. Mirounga ES2805-ORL TaxID=754514 RepID=UPI00197B4D38|nr:endonuclease/exonuclease/phosphatase family protein [Mycoplasma sp. Mirounga ES2805-ORL]QSF13529.1 hypothetical protein JXZ90_02530 [Mycoplasma sp. Mirounga ES2805-ORL]
MKTKTKKIIKGFGIALGSIVGLTTLGVGITAISYTALEYRPDKIEEIKSKKMVYKNQKYKILSWNIGYGGLGDNANFFYDGGEMIDTASRARVETNMQNIVLDTKMISPDIALFQEVDESSKRAHYFNEVDFLNTKLNNYANSFSYNFKVGHFPVPIKQPLGKIYAGLSNYSKLSVNNSKRYSLPDCKSWPVKTFWLKRNLLVNEYQIHNSSKKLYVVNLHLEAYGDGAKEQTIFLLNKITEFQQGGNYVIAAGDFNQIFSNVPKNKRPKIISKSNKSLWKPEEINSQLFIEKGFDVWMSNNPKTPSCRSLDRTYKGANKDNFQFYQIDGFITSSNIKVHSRKVENLEFLSSDHNPIILEFELN